VLNFFLFTIALFINTAMVAQAPQGFKYHAVEHDSADIYNIMQKGAKAVQLDTRFVTTKECDASDQFNQTYIDSKKKEVGIIQSPVGMPGRTIGNAFLDKVKQGLKMPKTCPFKCIKTCDIGSSPYCIITALFNAAKGNMTRLCFLRSNAYRATKITSVKELFTELKEGFKQKRESLNR
jgi:nitronate monooxygenase